MARRSVVVVVAASLLVQALCLPFEVRIRRGSEDNELDASKETPIDRADSGDDAITSPPATADTFESRGSMRTTPSSPMVPLDEDDDDDDFADFGNQPSGGGGGGGSNIFSLLNLAGSLFPGSSGGQIQYLLRHIARDLKQELAKGEQIQYLLRHISQDLKKELSKGDLNLEMLTKNLNRTPRDIGVTNNDIEEVLKKNSSEKKKNIETNESESDESINSTGETESISDESLSNENNASENSIEKPGDDSAQDASNSNVGNGNNGNGNGNNGNGNVNNGNGNGNGNNGNGNGYNGNGNGNNGNGNISNGDKSDEDGNGNSNSNSDEFDSNEPPEGDGQGGGLLGLLAGLSGGEDGMSDLGSLLATVGGIIASLSGDGVDINAIIGSALGLLVGLLSEGEENPGSVIASYLLTSLDTISGGGAGGDATGVRTQNGAASSPLWDFKLDIFKALVRLITGVIGSTFASSSSSNSISG